MKKLVDYNKILEKWNEEDQKAITEAIKYFLKTIKAVPIFTDVALNSSKFFIWSGLLCAFFVFFGYPYWVFLAPIAIYIFLFIMNIVDMILITNSMMKAEEWLSKNNIVCSINDLIMIAIGILSEYKERDYESY